MEKITLFNIGNEFVELVNQIQENEGELTPELENALKINEENFIQKTVSYYQFMTDIKSKIEQGEALKKEIDKKIKQFQNVFDKCSKNVKEAMLLYEKETAGDDFYKFKLRKSVSVEIEDDTLIPKKFMVEKVVTSPDKNSIKSALKAGESVPGCALKTNQNLQM